MASLRFYKYSEKDLKSEDLNKYEESIRRYYGDLSDREWAVHQDSIVKNTEKNIISFIISKMENKEFSTTEGLKEFSYIEYYPIIMFIENNIIAFSKSTNRTVSLMLKKHVEKILFNDKLDCSPEEMKTNEILLSKLDEDMDLELRGVSSRNAMDIDKISGSDRSDIRGKDYYEKACQGDITSKTCVKVFPDPIGKVKFCLRIDGLITIFRRTLSVDHTTTIIEAILKYLENPSKFQRNLGSYK
ncbi:MAG: hypothetical protein KAK00_06310 [Nanoarchaeota archaeon]|nr:hypothetical protein [Nanoarchaeota archaeon]